jgi:hypothetical protein
MTEYPPGVSHLVSAKLKEVSKGGTVDWQPLLPTKLYTNAFVFADQGRKVRLAQCLP